MWYEKYRPEGSLKSYFGNRSNVRITVNWMNSVIKGNPIGKGVLFYGPPGTGKTSLVQVLSDVYKIKFVHTNASDSRRADDIKKILSQGSSRGLTKKTTFVILDEGEAISAKYLKKIIENTHCILITNEKYELAKGVRNSLIDLEFEYPSKNEKEKYINFILKEEDKKLSSSDISKIVSNSLTFRSIAKNLQLVCVSGITDFMEERTDFGMFEEISRLFAGKDVGRAKTRPRDLLKWALDNEGNPALISALDRMLGKTPPNDYRGWKYTYDLIEFTNASSDVNYPRFFRLLSKYKEK